LFHPVDDVKASDRKSTTIEGRSTTIAHPLQKRGGDRRPAIGIANPVISWRSRAAQKNAETNPDRDIDEAMTNSAEKGRNLSPKRAYRAAVHLAANDTSQNLSSGRSALNDNPHQAGSFTPQVHRRLRRSGAAGSHSESSSIGIGSTAAAP